MNIWDCEGYKVIPTNKCVRKDGHAVMGAGLAKQAASMYPGLAQEYGKSIMEFKSILHEYNVGSHFKLTLIHFHKDLILLPTKNHWRNPSTLKIVEDSLTVLPTYFNPQGNAFIAQYFPNIRPIKKQPIWFPRIGCGLGGLNWKDVKPLIELNVPNAQYTHP